ncbi:MAG: nitrogenase iron-molybdenum cofactor biosynthesis protein NifN, partial [Thermaerobacter sp.]|nr:nitrogenase iron-molybdenum cofactor biosynthesis protein NifN [Thermaerobacter sp.]
MARVEYHRQALSVDPLKTSPALGGALAFLGLDRCIPLLHGSVGCANFAKVLLTRHFREPIPLASTALTDLGACMGGGETALEALRRVAAKGPAVIGLLSTALTETKGDDLAATVREFRAAFPEPAAPPVIAAATPDFAGSLQEGYAAAVEAILREAARPGERRSGLVNVLAGPALTPADVDAVRAMVEAFGLTPLVVPDLSRSLDGHLDREPAP